MRESLKQLLQPDVGVGAKLVAISMFIGKMFERHDERLVDLEKRQLQKGDKGDKGDPPSEAEISAALHEACAKKEKEEKEDLARLMAKSWETW